METTQTWVPEDTFADRLRILRKQRHLTIEQAAAVCELSAATWGTWEQKGARPHRYDDVVNQIADKTKVDSDWLRWGWGRADPEVTRLRHAVEVMEQLTEGAVALEVMTREQEARRLRSR